MLVSRLVALQVCASCTHRLHMSTSDANAGYGLSAEQLRCRSAERMFESETCSDMAASRLEAAQHELSVAEVRARIAATAAVRAQSTAQRSHAELEAAEQAGAPRLPPYRRRRLKQKAQREKERATMMQCIEREAHEVVSQASAELAAAELAVDEVASRNGVATVKNYNVNDAVEFMAKYLPQVNPQVATKEKADDLREKVTAQDYKDDIVKDGLSSVFYDSDGTIRAASFGRKLQIGAEDQDVYVGEGERENKLGKLAMLAQWQEQDNSLRPDQCATFGYLAVDICYFQAPIAAGAMAVELLNYNVELARKQGINHIRSPSQGLFKDTVISQQADFAIWSANESASDYTARSTNEYLNDWNDYTRRPDPCVQWVYTGS